MYEKRINNPVFVDALSHVHCLHSHLLVGHAAVSLGFAYLLLSNLDEGEPVRAPSDPWPSETMKRRWQLLFENKMKRSREKERERERGGGRESRGEREREGEKEIEREREREREREKEREREREREEMRTERERNLRVVSGYQIWLLSLIVYAG